MPVLERLLQKLHPKDDAPSPVGSSPTKPTPPKSDPVPPEPETTYYLSSSSGASSSSCLHAVSPATLIFGFTRPSPSTSSATEFFLRCLPDPISFMEKSALYIHSELSQRSSSRRPVSLEDGIDALRIAEDVKWRHQYLHLRLADEGGLAYTTDGKITVSLEWVSHVSGEVDRGQRDMKGAEREFKGVLLHELVHTIQYDGAHSLPGWLVESIADYVRLHADLGPPHWRKPGQGRREKGWEDAYDAGARFLDWVTGEDGSGVSVVGSGNASSDGSGGQSTVEPTPNRTSVPPAPSATQYPASPAPPLPNGDQRPLPGKKRRAPIPNFVRDLNARLQREKWRYEWWVEMVGVPLDVLWAEYLDYYGIS